MEVDKSKLTLEQLAKLKALYEYENPTPRNRAERRLQNKKSKFRNKSVGG